jgi:hypothetical protein
MSKYRAKPTVVDGKRFASKREAEHYIVLKSDRDVVDLELQPRFKIVVNNQLICTYVADFRFRRKKSGTKHVQDVKGFRTREYIIKKKLVKAALGIEVEEVK